MDGSTPVAWVQIISNVGLPLALVVYYLTVERPALRKREELQEVKFRETIAITLKEQRIDFEMGKQKDRESSLEVARLTGEIQKMAHETLRDSIGRHGEIVTRMEGKLDRALEEFKRK